jgi:aspartyl aminopeptidase
LIYIDNNDSKFNDKKNYTAFKQFIDNIKSLYNLTNTKITRQHKKNIGNFNSTKQNRRKFTSSQYFMIDTEKYQILIPENFLKIKLNSNGKIIKKSSVVQQTTKKSSMFGNNNNNNI